MPSRFAARFTGPELMDTEDVEFAEFHECLQQLAVINSWTLAYRPTLQWLSEILPLLDRSHCLSILDIGSGGGDMLRRIARWNGGRFSLDLTGIDINPWSQLSAEMQRSTEEICYETCDLFALPPETRADFIVSSLFTHHLPDEMLVRFLRWMERHATRGWFINDLHRHVVPYVVIKYIVRLLRCNRLIVHDAPVSILRAFTARDWRRLLTEAEIPLEAVSIRWHFPFRYCLSRRKP
ncbi:MAG TPA: methyltransferase domain-containing protein [Chthoniobacteraceae bacterium]|jgi:SAM-dependent methyltransferase